MYYVTLHIYGSLWVAHTTSVHDKYTLHHSFKKIESLYDTKEKPQNTFDASKEHPINRKAMLKNYFQQRSSHLHQKVEGIG